MVLSLPVNQVNSKFAHQTSFQLQIPIKSRYTHLTDMLIFIGYDNICMIMMVMLTNSPFGMPMIWSRRLSGVASTIGKSILAC